MQALITFQERCVCFVTTGHLSLPVFLTGNLCACSEHEGKTGVDKSAQLLTRKKKTNKQKTLSPERDEATPSAFA